MEIFKEILNFISSLAWPIVVLILGFHLKGSVAELISKLFSNREVEEFTASTTGISAKFVQRQQATDTSASGSKPLNLPPGMSYDDIIEKQKRTTTTYSEALLRDIRQHVDALNLEDSTKCEVLMKELSLVTAGARFFRINSVLFKSQFDLFNTLMSNGMAAPYKAVESYFNNVVQPNIESFKAWDVDKYLSYPISEGLIFLDDNGFRLTELGESYIEFLRCNTDYISELTVV